MDGLFWLKNSSKSASFLKIHVRFILVLFSITGLIQLMFSSLVEQQLKVLCAVVRVIIVVKVISGKLIFEGIFLNCYFSALLRVRFCKA